MSENTAVTAKVPLPAAYAADIQRRKERNSVATAIRGTQWGKEVSETVVRAVAEYAHRIGVDPVRHIEVLGGRIYLTADFYRERGAPMVKSGLMKAPQLEHIAADARLDALAAGTTSIAPWATEEGARRMKLRIQFGVPEGAKAAVVCRIELRDGSVIEGCNWVGGTAKRDPVGDAEPSKTAESRAERRAWRRLVEVMPAAAPDLVNAEAVRTEVNAQIPDAEISEVRSLPHGDIPLRAAVSKLAVLDDVTGTSAEQAQKSDDGADWIESDTTS